MVINIDQNEGLGAKVGDIVKISISIASFTGLVVKGREWTFFYGDLF